MQPRDHLVVFAKRMIPANTFQSPEQMFAELTGPKREAFVFYLWNEAGKQVERPLPHVDKFKGADGIPRLAKLEVVGAVKPVGHEIVVISMPPAINANEVLYLALVRRPTGVSVFFYERCMGNDHATVSPNEAVLAEMRADGSRLNHGFKEGIDLEAFKTHLGGVLGVSLAGLETSLPAISMADFMGAGKGAGARARSVEASGDASGAKSLGGVLAMMAAICAVQPLVMKVPVLGSLVWVLWRFIDPLIGVAMGLSLLIWVYKVHAARRGQTTISPGWSVGLWFLPIAQIFTIPLTVASAFRGATGRGAGGLVLLWWLFFIPAMGMRNLRVMSQWLPGQMSVPRDVWEAMYYGGWFVEGVAYGLLFYIVNKASDEL